MDKQANQIRAHKKIKEYKDFYRHIVVFLITNGCFYILKNGWALSLFPDAFTWQPYYFGWVDVNVAIWGLILLLHAGYVYRDCFPFLKNWEDRQIKKYMDQDQEQQKKHTRYE